jgi:hypothetical protein
MRKMPLSWQGLKEGRRLQMFVGIIKKPWLKDHVKEQGIDLELSFRVRPSTVSGRYKRERR